MSKRIPRTEKENTGESLDVRQSLLLSERQRAGLEELAHQSRTNISEVLRALVDTALADNNIKAKK